MCQQHFKADADVNRIIDRYVKTGFLPTSPIPPLYADVSSLGDYQSLIDNIRRSHELFDELPSELRKRFGNDPGQLIDFINDPDNLDEAVKLGLLTQGAVSQASSPASAVPASAEREPSTESEPKA